MEARIVRIGTSIGVILPKAVVKDLELRIGHKLDLLVNSRMEMVLRKKKCAREGWAEIFSTSIQSSNNHCDSDYIKVAVDKQLESIEV